MFAFRRGQRDSLPPSVDVAGKVAWLKQRITLFNQQMEITGLLLDQLTGPIYGFGAAHMLATLDYHLGHRVKNLACILDDDTKKEGFSYRNVDVNVRSTSVFLPPNQSNYMITSMENVRSIFMRIQTLNPRRILVPQIS